MRREAVVLPDYLLADRANMTTIWLCPGDGQLITMLCHPETGQLTNRIQNTLGTRSVTLAPFEARDGKRHVFAASDRPAIVYSARQRLVFAGVNLKASHCRGGHSCVAPA